MADKAHNETDGILADMEAHLAEIYEQAGEEIEVKAAEYFSQFERLDAQKKKQVEDGRISEDEYIRWRKNKILYGKHWTQLKEKIAAEYANVNRIALAYINGRLPKIYALNYNAIGKDIGSAVKGYSFELINADLVKNLATKDDTLLPYKYLDGKKDVRWNTKKVNSAVLQGILQGESIPKMSKRLQSVTGMNKTAAIRNARTCVTGAECKARQDGFERAAADGIELQREWIAAIDGRTRHAHRLLDGQLVGVDEPFKSELGAIMFPGDPEASPENVYNCRCTIAAKVIGFGKVNLNNSMSAGKASAPEGKAEHIGVVDFADEKAILKALEDGERNAISLPYEVNYTVTSDGKVWRVKGTDGAVNPSSIPSNLIGSYTYHNHPENKTWYSFSAEDVGFFFDNKLKYSKASDNEFEYVMERTDQTIDMDYESMYNIFKQIERNEVMEMKWLKIIDPDIDGYHIILQILSERYNFIYFRRKNNGDK